MRSATCASHWIRCLPYAGRKSDGSVELFGLEAEAAESCVGCKEDAKRLALQALIISVIDVICP